MCRFKLPLRDLGASTLEDKLRGLLEIDPSVDCVFERYSDSATAFVVLDRTNVSVYKQLYRAAKAKGRLKLKVTHVTEQGDETEKPTKSEPSPVDTEQPQKAAFNASEMAEVPKMEPLVPKPMVTNCTFTPSPFSYPPNLKLDSDSTLMPREPMPEPTPEPAPVVEEPKAEPEIKIEPVAPTFYPTTTFAVCCNNCDANIPDAHFHCQSCDDGDFDLCQACLDKGVYCYNPDEHWLVKRVVRNGRIISSTTEKISPKSKSKSNSGPQSPPLVVPVSAPQPTIYHHIAPEVKHAERIIPIPTSYYNIRTCNCCVQEFPDTQFVHCTSCDDYDLCKTCFIKDKHGHHPAHAFEPAVDGTTVEPVVSVRLAAGRNLRHNAICDGCDKFISGVRHKCLDCPDWDYCAECVVNADFIHSGHRFVPVYEPLRNTRIYAHRPVHVGICCDGPLCSAARNSSYITGDRYKCAICHDTDFCANCEASPSNSHNKTHPLIKFKTPVRHATVTTTGDKADGGVLPVMGDRIRPVRTSSVTSNNTATAVKTVASVTPSAPEPPKAVEPVEPVESVAKSVEETSPVPDIARTPRLEQLQASYVRDSVADGTVMPPSKVFEQTWVLRNDGKISWPAGCSVKFVGGDYMGHVDPAHPAGVHELVSASESTVCYAPLAPGQEFAFTVLLRTPPREGKTISYWRLTTKEGDRFGHRLWCDVNVSVPKPVEKVEIKQEEPEIEAKPEASESQMIFPKLDKESPVASVHEEASPAPIVAQPEEEIEELEDCADDDEWAEDESFLTDEEYDILDASDEEYLEQQQLALKK